MQSPLHPNYLHATGMPNEGMGHSVNGTSLRAQGTRLDYFELRIANFEFLNLRNND